jgi:hypothetical protein
MCILKGVHMIARIATVLAAGMVVSASSAWAQTGQVTFTKDIAAQLSGLLRVPGRCCAAAAARHHSESDGIFRQLQVFIGTVVGLGQHIHVV